MQIFKIFEVQAIAYREFKDYRANSVDPDEVAHYEPPHPDLCWLQIQLFSSLVFKELDGILKSSRLGDFSWLQCSSVIVERSLIAIKGAPD